MSRDAVDLIAAVVHLLLLLLLLHLVQLVWSWIKWFVLAGAGKSFQQSIGNGCLNQLGRNDREEVHGVVACG